MQCTCKISSIIWVKGFERASKASLRGLLDPIHFPFCQLELLAVLGEPEVVVLVESSIQSNLQRPARVVLSALT